MKTGILIAGIVLSAIALADLALGNTEHALPAIVGDQLNQQRDLFLGAVGAGAIWFSVTQL